MPDGDWTPGFVKRFEERLEPKPIQKCLFLVVIFVIPVAIIALVPTLIDALISSKNLFLFVGYSALRRVTQWLSDLFTFFYYVNQGRIADLEGAKKFTTAGGFVVLASFASIGMGLLMMALCMICASPLLRFLAPYEPELVDQTAYWALIIAAAWLPGTRAPIRPCSRASAHHGAKSPHRSNLPELGFWRSPRATADRPVVRPRVVLGAAGDGAPAPHHVEQHVRSTARRGQPYNPRPRHGALGMSG